MATRIFSRHGRALVCQVAGLTLVVAWSSTASMAGTGGTRNTRFTLARVDPCFVAPSPGGATDWPLAPVHRAHAIRGSFNEVRGDNVHFGVDVAALHDQSVVHSIAAGRILRLHPGRRGFSIGSLHHYLFYDHVVPLSTLHLGEWIDAGQVIGRRIMVMGHVHVSELDKPCGWINPMRPTGPLRVAQNTEPPTIGPLQAFVANSAAFRRFDPDENPALEHDPATPLQLTSLHGVVDLRAEVHDWPRLQMPGTQQLELEVAAIRAYLAPLSNRRAHLSPLKMIFDGATLLEPARLGTSFWHIWAFGTWRDSSGYFHEGDPIRGQLGAAYVWHVGGTLGLDTNLYPDGRYRYCVQALTINGVEGTRCARVVIDNSTQPEEARPLS
jgi:hypothetical protein